MQLLTPAFEIWIAADATGADWSLALTTTDLNEAAAFFEQQSDNGAHVAVYERGRYFNGRRYAIGFIGFWWSANLNEYMRGAPVGRGLGWTAQDDILVQYEYPGAVCAPVEEPAVSARAAATEAAPMDVYAQEQCEGCGRSAPVGTFRWLTHDVETGHSSGTHRQSRSYSTTVSRRGVSNTTRHSTGHTSGRRYYKRYSSSYATNASIASRVPIAPRR